MANHPARNLLLQWSSIKKSAFAEQQRRFKFSEVN